MDQEIIQAAKTIWHYHHVDHELSAADLIFVLCSNDLSVADRAAELYFQDYAPKILISGGFGNFTEGVFDRPEAELFAERVIKLGVPVDHILKESKSTNTGENVQFSRKVLASEGLAVQSIIAVQKPFMERRTYGAIKQFWPEVKVRVTSPQVTMERYAPESEAMNTLIHTMVGDF